MIVISTANTKHLVNESAVESVTFDHEKHTATITRPQLAPGHHSAQTIPDVENIRKLGENERVSWDNSELKRAHERSSFYLKKTNAYMNAFEKLRDDTLEKIRLTFFRYLSREDNPKAYDCLSELVDSINQGKYTPDFSPEPQQV